MLKMMARRYAKPAIAETPIAITIARGADLSAPLVSSLMWAHASNPVMVNWDISMPTRKIYLYRSM